jgi:hypothetical protein
LCTTSTAIAHSMDAFGHRSIGVRGHGGTSIGVMIAVCVVDADADAIGVHVQIVGSVGSMMTRHAIRVCADVGRHALSQWG